MMGCRGSPWGCRGLGGVSNGEGGRTLGTVAAGHDPKTGGTQASGSCHGCVGVCPRPPQNWGGPATPLPGLGGPGCWRRTTSRGGGGRGHLPDAWVPSGQVGGPWGWRQGRGSPPLPLRDRRGQWGHLDAWAPPGCRDAGVLPALGPPKGGPRYLVLGGGAEICPPTLRGDPGIGALAAPPPGEPRRPGAAFSFAETPVLGGGPESRAGAAVGVWQSAPPKGWVQSPPPTPGWCQGT